MTNLKLVFIPSPGAGHLPPMVELAKILLHRDQRLSVTIIVMKINLGAKHDFVITTDTPRLQFIDIAFDECTMALLSPHTFLLDLVEHHKRRVRDIARSITESDSSQLAGFIVNMFCLAMADVADEFGAPTYINFPSSAAMLGLMLTLQAKRDQDGHDVTELKDSESEICIPSYVNLVPAKLLPEIVFDKEDGAKMFLDLAKRFRQSKGIIVNTFQELDSHGVHHLLSSNDVDIPPLFPVGPILNLMNTSKEGKTEDIMNWLSDQPESSVVFLCFGSMGSFSKKQIIYGNLILQHQRYPIYKHHSDHDPQTLKVRRTRKRRDGESS